MALSLSSPVAGLLSPESCCIYAMSALLPEGFGFKSFLLTGLRTGFAAPALALGETIALISEAFLLTLRTVLGIGGFLEFLSSSFSPAASVDGFTLLA